ncbi:hypothetical protein V6N13_068195 [Hibiscus sabdariffa]
MSSLIWNVRGLNDPIKQINVLKVARRYDVEILCLLETRVWEHNASGIWSGKFRDWTVLHNYSHASNGMIWIFSRGCWKVVLIYKSAQVMHCRVVGGDTMFFLSIVYASNSREDRNALWSDLVEFQDEVGGHPWVIAGDFNVTFHPKESSDYTGG